MKIQALVTPEYWYGTIQCQNSEDSSFNYKCVTNSLYTWMIIPLSSVWQQRSQLPAHGYSEEWCGKRYVSTVHPCGCEFKSSGCHTDPTSSSSSSIKFRDACAEPAIGWSEGKLNEVAFSLSNKEVSGINSFPGAGAVLLWGDITHSLALVLLYRLAALAPALQLLNIWL